MGEARTQARQAKERISESSYVPTVQDRLGSRFTVQERLGGHVPVSRRLGPRSKGEPQHERGPRAVQARPTPTSRPLRPPRPGVRYSTNSPLYSSVLTQPPQKVKLPAHIRYDGTGDPTDHVKLFEGHMYLGEYSDATWCRHFPTTLTGLAQAWFQSLPSQTVTNFTQLSDLFIGHFVSGR